MHCRGHLYEQAATVAPDFPRVECAQVVDRHGGAGAHRVDAFGADAEPPQQGLVDAPGLRLALRQRARAGTERACAADEVVVGADPDNLVAGEQVCQRFAGRDDAGFFRGGDKRQLGELGRFPVQPRR